MVSITQALIHLDGGFCEGGGQLLRNAVTLSALLSKPVSISNVRQNRRPPGLRRQHEAGIKLAASICSAEIKGVEVGSTLVNFRPGPIQLPKDLIADPGSAGSTTLLLQVALPCLLFSPPPNQTSAQTSHEPSTSILTLRGGTNASLAPQIDYTQSILLPFLKKHFHVSPSLTVNRRGYYPKGGGSVLCTIPSIPGPLPPVHLTERGQVIALRGTARVGGLPLHIAERMVSGAYRTLRDNGFIDTTDTNVSLTSIRERDENVVGAGGGIMLWAETENGCLIGGSAVSTKEKKPQMVGEEAALELIRNLNHGGCVDEHLQDQIIIFLALAQGTSTVKVGPVTDHTRTAIHVAEQLTGAEFHVDESSPESAIITCKGIGFVPPPSTVASDATSAP